METPTPSNSSSLPVTYDHTKSNDYLRVVSSPQEEYEKAMIWFPPEEHAPVQDSLKQPFENVPSVGLGDLECLPYELLRLVCLPLDIHSLFQFRQVNRSARQVVTSLREYQKIAEHAPGALCAILRTRVSHWFTFPDLYTVFCTENCSRCRRFAGFLYLLEFKRYCITCIRTEGTFYSASSGAAKLNYLSLDEVRRSMPTLISLPGTYSLEHLPRPRRILMVSVSAVTEEAERRGFECEVPKDLDRASQILWLRQEYGKMIEPCFKYMTCTSLPWYDPATNQIDRGVSCLGCHVAFVRAEWRKKRHAIVRRGLLRSRNGFLKHFQRCPEAQRCWLSSENGTTPVELPAVDTNHWHLNYDRSLHGGNLQKVY
ncbi:hypothetical protein PRK78_002800 [Emydomyces testavorans]|uniref:F-box domain-containing protein n=1 Tax=Emydomyces testavorans TaxID=2070801 RepID=A0AAF0DGH0_9EURO|nr:hypothetical protein PRK78_002800 [Emydomyces testavorans]